MVASLILRWDKAGRILANGRRKGQADSANRHRERPAAHSGWQRALFSCFRTEGTLTCNASDLLREFYCGSSGLSIVQFSTAHSFFLIAKFSCVPQHEPTRRHMAWWFELRSGESLLLFGGSHANKAEAQQAAEIARAIWSLSKGPKTLTVRLGTSARN